MKKVWMVWKDVDFNQDWLEGVFNSEAKAEDAMDELFNEWLNDRKKVFGEEAENFDSPFFLTEEVVQ